VYADGDYARRHPTWHAEHSAWKARQVLRMMTRHGLAPHTVAEVGCGAGEILKQLHDTMPDHVRFVGYDISPQAHRLSQARAGERLRFTLGDFTREEPVVFDVLLLMDIVEHIEDCYRFLRDVRSRSRYQILHLPLDLSVQAVLRPRFFRALHTSAGHLHYFSKETALQLLADAGYEVLDAFYTAPAVQFAPTSWPMALARLPRRCLFALHQDGAARLLGGFSLLVLTR
jgi:SAM-dependent methyltransferase